MTNPVSIQFKNGTEISAALYNDFYGEWLVGEAEAYAMWVKHYMIQDEIGRAHV